MTFDSARQNDHHGGYELVNLLLRQDIDALFVSSESDIIKLRESSTNRLALIDTAFLTSTEVRWWARACASLGIPIIALVPPSQIATLDATLTITDFISSPPDPDELVARARFAVEEKIPESTSKHNECIKIRDLVINKSSYEVTLRSERIGLRFKEYELLRTLAEKPGRVFTREALLNQIWGYEYFGGTRTVDVHIRRLRSKIEDSDHSYIETIWNVGYRFNGS